MVALCAIWAASSSTHDVLRSWHEGRFLGWLDHDLGEDFACMVAIAAVMGLPLVAVGNLGPQAGWRRVAALAATVALVGPAGRAGPIRLLVRDRRMSLPADRRPESVVTFWFRYAQLAALITIVAEFHRRETRSVEAMHRAEIDRLALDREMAEARLQVLQAQIEPHFLFNTLANVRRLYQMDLAAGRAMLDNLMRYLEVALPRMREERSTVGRELSLIEAYLKVQGSAWDGGWPSRSTCPPQLQRSTDAADDAPDPGRERDQARLESAAAKAVRSGSARAATAAACASMSPTTAAVSMTRPAAASASPTSGRGSPRCMPMRRA